MGPGWLVGWLVFFVGRRPHSPRAVDHHHLPPGRDWTNLKSNLTIFPHMYPISYFLYANVERCMSVILLPIPYLGGQYTTGTTIAAWKVKKGRRKGEGRREDRLEFQL